MNIIMGAIIGVMFPAFLVGLIDILEYRKEKRNNNE